MLCFVIPTIPIAKGRPRFGGGRVYTPKRTKDYEALVAMLGKREMRGKPPSPQPVTLKVRFELPIPKSWKKSKREAALSGELKPIIKPDYDNFLKAIMDGLNGVVWEDDAQIWRHSGEKIYGPNPGTTIEVTLD